MGVPLSNVVHITSWISRQGGGIPPVIWSQAREFNRLGLNASVAGLADEFVAQDCAPKELPFVTGDIMGPKAFGFSPGLRDALYKSQGQGGVVHSHGLWMYSGTLARNLARRTGCPLVVSPHGMLEPWALRNSGWKKRLAGWLFENRNLRSAACLHALCEPEAADMRRYGLRNPIAVIPNGIASEDFSPLPDYNAIEAAHPFAKGKKRMLFLSRIHPKKGLPHLIKAWERAVKNHGEWILMVCGNDQVGHRAEMEKLSAELGLEKSVYFVGPAFGEPKLRLLAGSDAFVLPSLSEGFSVAALEAALCGLPTLLTPQCNFPELTAAGGALEAQPDVDGCEAGLRRMFSKSDAERKEMGWRGKELVLKSYTWREIAARLIRVYSWVNGDEKAPEWVKFN